MDEALLSQTVNLLLNPPLQLLTYPLPITHYQTMFRNWTLDDWINHVLFIATILYLFYSFFLHH
ncbi:hypothetical protein C7Y66_19120 [Chroococcidiopsis sp. CCALA 051]|nr:hypothetical protein C7Y66_19120 [Chroococcidiopsis sp. CCALA 051]